MHQIRETLFCMIEHLFGSKTRLQVLRYLFDHPETPFFVRELTRALNSQINAIRRELELLEHAGVIVAAEPPGDVSSARPGAQLRKYYRLDTQSLLFPELQALLAKERVMNEQQFLTALKEKGGDISLLILSGIFTKDSDAPIDLLMVGDLKERNIMKHIDGYEKDHGVSIRYTFMSEREFLDRRHVMDRFLYEVLEAKHMKVINELHI